MELEEQWWKGQLAADIHQSLRSKELELPPYKCQSPQLHLRRYFVDLLAVTGNHFRLCPAVRHLAVYLLDLFMDRYNVTVQELHIVSLTCLVLASKFEGVRGQVPSLENLNSLGCMTSLNLMLTEHGLLQMEVLLLQLFQWNLCLPTAAHFIDYYMSIAVNEGDLHDGWPMTNPEEEKSYMAKYTDYFLEVCLQDHVFLYFPHSVVAAACVASSRLVLHLSPTWPPRLELLTGYTSADLVPCVEKLLIAHDGDFKEANKHKWQQQQQQGQTGYHSAGRPSTVAQYLSLSGMQYPEQTVLMGLAPDYRPAFYLG